MSPNGFYALVGLYGICKNIVKLGIVTWPVSRLFFNERNMSINFDNPNIKILEVKKDNFLYFDRLSVAWMLNTPPTLPHIPSINTQNYYSFRKIHLQVNNKKVDRQTKDFILHDDTD